MKFVVTYVCFPQAVYCAVEIVAGNGAEALAKARETVPVSGWYWNADNLDPRDVRLLAVQDEHQNTIYSETQQRKAANNADV